MTKKGIPYFADFRVLHEFLVIQNSNNFFTHFFHGRLLSRYLLSQLTLTAKTDHFEGQISLEAGKTLILLNFVCYSPESF